MFSFFKFLQQTLKNLKQNKGLWFTTLAVISIVGIFLSLYLLTHMTQSASEEVYESISTTYNKSYKNNVNEKQREFRRIIYTITSNNNFINNIQSNNLIAVQEDIKTYNEGFKKTGSNSLESVFYPVINQVNQYRNSINSVITSRNKAFGLEVLLEGVYFVYIEPIIKDDVLIGVLELKEHLHSFKDDYLKENSIFLFLLEEKMLNKLSINARNGKYREVLDETLVQEDKYDSLFYGKIIENGRDAYRNMVETGYSVDDVYFRSVQKVSDLNGNVIGLVILGQTVADTGAFVNIVDRMTKMVTTVALGLVISILLFMF